MMIFVPKLLPSPSEGVKERRALFFIPLPPSKEDVGHYNQRTNNQRWN